MLVADLAGDAPGLHEAGLKPSALLAEGDEHCSGITGRILLVQGFRCHYPRFLKP
jgi:hypothetical protein